MPLKALSTPPAVVIPEIVDWFDLERCVAAVYYAAGYQVFLSGGFRPDGGVDLVVLLDGRATVVQCKFWKKAVGVGQARELLGAMVDFRAAKAVLVAPNGFTRDVPLFAQRNGMELIDQESLDHALGIYTNRAGFQDAYRYFLQKCPKCGADLKQRSNPETKELFWGCSHYPSCKHTQANFHRRVLEPLKAG